MKREQTILVWAEHTVMSGRCVAQHLIDERGESDDWLSVELSESEADYYDQLRMGPFGSRVAKSIRSEMACL